jgi:hypothetical protein
MDYHLQYRMAHLHPSSPKLFGPKRNRFPSSSIPPISRSDCAHHASAERPAFAEPNPAPAAAPAQPEFAQQPTNDSPQTREQVKQLQFWLKVFARFCHDGAESD